MAIAGKVKAGKSTLLNALVGEELAATDAGECTRIVTWYARRPHLRGHRAPDRRHGRGSARSTGVAGAVQIALGRPAEEVDHLEVRVPSARLRRHTLIDTPGIASLSTDVSLRTMAFLEAEGERAAQTDAVIYLLRHMHGSDVRFLESFHGDGLASGTPVNAVGVLSRADEIGGCRLDAMDAAARVAARYATDERLRRLCPVVVPVAGLLGAAGATLREDEYRALAAVAAEPMDRRGRAAADRRPVRRAPRRAAAAHVLSRLGLFGVRLSVRLIREGTVARLRRPGPGAHRAQRHRPAARGVHRPVRRPQRGAQGPVGAGRAGRVHPAGLGRWPPRRERIRASAHEFVELRLLHQVRSGRLPGVRRATRRDGSAARRGGRRRARAAGSARRTRRRSGSPPRPRRRWRAGRRSPSTRSRPGS